MCPGASNNPVIGNPAHWMSSSSFCLQPAGFYGNLGRNTVIGPGLVDLDLSLMKDIPLNERMHLQFICQFFNALNHPNFGAPANVVFSDTTGVPLPNFGVISQTATTSRQLQFALKLLF